MKEALQSVRKDFDKTYPLFIGEREIWTDAVKASHNPARPDEVVGTVCYATRREAERAVEEATRAWKIWRKIAPQERAQCLLRSALAMRQKRFELMALQVYEVGKSWKEADGDVGEAIDFLEYYAREMLRLGTPIILGDLPGELNQYLYEPRGVGVVISPWNFPMAIPTGMVCAAIVAGNCVIFKPSGLSMGALRN
jgi:RHH-type proline utilization regulon transcriptional repressor/proline dehydrogenase/delta 1-pyrroline-5-carboxylate dehydrogenase